jgi:hypothetical protein
LQDGVILNDEGATPTSGGSGTATSGDDLFTLSPTANLTITGYDAAGQDALGIRTGAGGFALAHYTNQATLTVVDAAQWWNNISGAQVVRWTGDLTVVDTPEEVDGLLQAMPGNGGGGVLFVGDAPGDRIAVYYDANPAQWGGVTQVATLEGLTATTVLNASDFRPGGSAPPLGSSPTIHTGPSQTGTAGDDIFSLSSSPTGIFNFDSAGEDALGLRSGSGGLQLAGHSGQADLTMVDASAWWNGIGGAQVVRWTGDPTAVDTAAEVDALLEAMPGNRGGGRLFIGGAEGGKVGVYYDADPLVRGNTSLIATIDNLSDPRTLVTDDFHLFA